MASTKKQLLGYLTASALTAGLLSAAPAQAELAASAAISNMYLWRGIDLGDGSAAVSGDLVYKFGPGFKTGIWISSGDSGLGQEYDYFAGWAGEVGGLGVDLTFWNYNYSDMNTGKADFADDGTDDTTGDLSEMVLTLSYAGVSFAYYDNIAGQGPVGESADDYEYYTLGYSYEKFSALVGYHDNTEESDGEDFDGDGTVEEDVDMTHLDLSYAYNDRLSFTVSKILDKGGDTTYDDDVQFALKYSLPIDL